MEADTTDTAPTTLCVTVRGTPRPKQSARFVGGRAIAVTDAVARTRAWARQVRRAAEGALTTLRAAGTEWRAEGAVEVTLGFAIGTDDPARWGTWHTIPPDTDNLAKLMLDELGKAGVFANDASVARSVTEKRWAPKAGAGCIVVVRAGLAQARQEGPLAPGWLVV